MHMAEIPAEKSVVLDAQSLRSLAHPVRVQLLGMLRTHGPATATQLADRLALNSGATSYHLRQLAAAGFVAEDTERGTARERWWRSVHQLTQFSFEELAGQDPEGALVFLQSVHNTYTMRTQQALNGLQALPQPWREAFDMSDATLRLTSEEAQQLREEVWSVIDRYRRSPDDVEPPETDSVWVNVHVLPDVDVTERETGC